jgi:hypothetical protein
MRCDEGSETKPAAELKSQQGVDKVQIYVE